MLDEVWAPDPTRFFKEKLAESAERHARAGRLASISCSRS